MKQEQFDKLARKYFGELLGPHGFSSEKSKYCTFYRTLPNGITHVILPELGGSGRWFHVVVFATSPLIESGFLELFPDSLGFTNGSFGRLDVDYGVGSDRTTFRCNKKEGFIRNFTREAAPAILSHALPYLDRIQNLDDMIPSIRDEFYMGMALWHTGKKEEAKQILYKERERLSNLTKDPDGVIEGAIDFIDHTLTP